MTRKLLALTLSALLVLSFGTGSPHADAAKKKTFRQAYGCAFGEEISKGVAELKAFTGAGHWTTYKGAKGDPCDFDTWDYWHPTTGKFTATFRWYLGSKVIKKNSFTARNNGSWYVQFSTIHRKDIHDKDGNGVWTSHGKRVKVKITLSKAGYKSKSVWVTKFFMQLA